MSLLETRSYYKPFKYPWAFDAFKKSEQSHWLPEEVDFREDLTDWRNNLSDAERNLLTQLFRFFTQADVSVADGYRKRFGPALGGHPEVAMMMQSFGAREAVHIDAYSTLIETLGLPEDTYKAFLEYQEMRDKADYLESLDSESVEDLLVSLALYAGFTEGLQLFSSFAVLMNFERHGKMKGMSNIIRWSIKDESLHVEGMTQLFRTLLSENPNDKIEIYIRSCATEMVELEDKFIDLMFAQGDPEGLNKEDLKVYIRFLANKRWSQLGFNGKLYENVESNPLDWLDWVVNAPLHGNFFEMKPTDYSKGSVSKGEEEISW